MQLMRFSSIFGNIIRIDIRPTPVEYNWWYIDHVCICTYNQYTYEYIYSSEIIKFVPTHTDVDINRELEQITTNCTLKY